jgi:hypothetical protein
MKDEEIISGEKVGGLHTLGSYYDAGYIIGARLNGETVRLSINEFAKILDMVTFKVTQARKYKHLELIKPPDYKEAYNILMDYWDDLPEDLHEEIHERLEEIGL